MQYCQKRSVLSLNTCFTATFNHFSRLTLYGLLSFIAALPFFSSHESIAKINFQSKSGYPAYRIRNKDLKHKAELSDTISESRSADYILERGVFAQHQ